MAGEHLYVRCYKKRRKGMGIMRASNNNRYSTTDVHHSLAREGLWSYKLKIFVPMGFNF